MNVPTWTGIVFLDAIAEVVDEGEYWGGGGGVELGLPVLETVNVVAESPLPIIFIVTTLTSITVTSWYTTTVQSLLEPAVGYA